MDDPSRKYRSRPFPVTTDDDNVERQPHAVSPSFSPKGPAITPTFSPRYVQALCKNKVQASVNK